MPKRKAIWRHYFWLCLLPTCAGCSDFPVIAGLSPWTRKEWAEDEKYTLTFHAKVREINELAAAAKQGSPADKDRYARLIADKLQTENNSVLRQALVRALGNADGEVARQTLQVCLGDTDVRVRQVTCESLGQMKTAEAAAMLANVLGTEQELDVRLAAARGLASFPGNADAIRSLGTLLDDSNPAVQYRAVQSLRTITSRDIGDNVAAWREYVNSGDAFAPRPPVSLAERFRSIF